MQLQIKNTLVYVVVLLMVGSLSTPSMYAQALVESSARRLMHTWMADNGNGTYSNPLFYDEFSDPDVIRVGDDYYLTGTTMHTMPGLPVLRSRDLVNWTFITYAVDKLDLGPEFRLEDGKEVYGQGIWAPCLRYHNGTYYIFANVNKKHTQLFTATNPAGPWTHSEMKGSFHDLSILFDDDGKIYMVWGYDEVHAAELTPDLSDIAPGTERIIIPKGKGAGEGSHFYRINGKYYITMANWDPVCYQICARADRPFGPYEISVISAGEHFGFGVGWKIPWSASERRFDTYPPRENLSGCNVMHQGGLVETQTGEWWALSMTDHNSVGRLTCLSPVTWENGWPLLGLPGNLTRTPTTWIKPRTGFTSKPAAPYERSDDFSGPALKPIWQWNHVPASGYWSLDERRGYLSLKSMPAEDFWHARNSLTQRAIGPECTATTILDATMLKDGDVAGLALLNFPYGWIGVSREGKTLEVRQFDQRTNQLGNRKAVAQRIWFRSHCNFDTEIAQFSYSIDGVAFIPLGDPFIMGYQLKTFQGVRFALFNYNTRKTDGGTAAFDSFELDEPRPGGLTCPIPCDSAITLMSLADSTVLVNWKDALRPVSLSNPLAQGAASQFVIVDRGNGRVSLRSKLDGGFVTVKDDGRMSQVRIETDGNTSASTFQWVDMMRGDLMLLSLQTNRYLFVDPQAGSLCSADSPGCRPDRKDGSCFVWTIRSDSN
jgi:xylan 1,4-beta-xylosidase